MPEEDEEPQAVTDRSYWENRGTKETVALADEMLEMVKTFAPDLEVNRRYRRRRPSVAGR